MQDGKLLDLGFDQDRSSPSSSLLEAEFIKFITEELFETVGAGETVDRH
jgi:hypothetical protein